MERAAVLTGHLVPDPPQERPPAVLPVQMAADKESDEEPQEEERYARASGGICACMGELVISGSVVAVCLLDASHLRPLSRLTLRSEDMQKELELKIEINPSTKESAPLLFPRCLLTHPSGGNWRPLQRA